jgi:hypothetical protein
MSKTLPDLVGSPTSDKERLTSKRVKFNALPPFKPHQAHGPA